MNLRISSPITEDYSKYTHDPVAFCHDVLGVHLWSKQAEIAEALVKHRRVLVKSANSIGKSFTAACLTLWFYCCHDPGICLLTAPTFRQVKDITFKEIRRIYRGPGLYDKLPRIESSPDHYVHGFTTTDATAFQGIHNENLLVVFEECVGIDADFWEAAKACLIGGSSYFLAICNPTDKTSQAYLEEESGLWHVISVSAFDHPNIALELAEQTPLIPGAIRLNEVDRLMQEWCEPTDEDTSIDIVWRGQRYRPGPIAEARLLGRYPTQDSYSVFSEADFITAMSANQSWTIHDTIHVGCDVARFGDDMTVIHARRGPVSIHHEAFNNRDTVYTANRLKQLAMELAGESARKIPIKIDDAGVGGGVVDQRDGFNFIPVNGACRSYSGKYPNRRSELLFDLSDLMKDKKVDLSRLPKEQAQELKRQAMSVSYKLDNQGRRVAEKKDDIKERLHRSPDDLDALCLCYSREGSFVAYEPLKQPEKKSIVRF